MWYCFQTAADKNASVELQRTRRIWIIFIDQALRKNDNNHCHIAITFKRKGYVKVGHPLGMENVEQSYLTIDRPRWRCYRQPYDSVGRRRWATGLWLSGKEMLNGRFVTDWVSLWQGRWTAALWQREGSLMTERDWTTAFGIENWKMMHDTEVCLNNPVLYYVSHNLCLFVSHIFFNMHFPYV